MDRLFLDANVLLSAALEPDAMMRRFWDFPDVELLTSDYAFEEASRNLKTPAQRLLLGRLAGGVVRAVPPLSLAHALEEELPEKDAPILAAAAYLKATHLVTGDNRHFKNLYGRRIQGVRIVKPAEYLKTRAR